MGVPNRRNTHLNCYLSQNSDRSRQNIGRAGCGGLVPGFAFVPQIQGFNFFSGPEGPSQKLQAGFDARVMSKTPDADDPSHFLPAMKFYQPGQNHFQGDAVKRIVGLPPSHVSA